MFPIDRNLAIVLGATAVALLLGSLIRAWRMRHADSETRRKRLGSLAVWWVLLLMVAVALILGRWGLVALLAVVSGLALRELVNFCGGWSIVGGLTVVGLALISGAHFGALAASDGAAFPTFYPLLLLGGLAVLRLLPRQRGGGTPVTAGLFWGAMLLVYGLSFSVGLVDASAERQPWAGPMGWFVFVVLLTEGNDILQALVGRRWGRRPITPILSPHKTVEGWLGGLVGTMLLALVLGPWLTVWPGSLGTGTQTAVLLLSGILVAASGFAGDLNFSALKRNAGIKDSSQLLPGMGGMIDRVDSLTLSAPALYGYVRLVEALA